MMDVKHSGIARRPAPAADTAAATLMPVPSATAPPRIESLKRQLDAKRTHKLHLKTSHADQAAPLAAGTAPSEGAPARAASAPAGLFSSVSEPKEGVLLERAVRQNDACTESSPSLPGETAATPVLRAAVRVMQTLGTACDAVFQGGNAIGRGCRHAYDIVQDACVSLLRNTSAEKDVRGDVRGYKAPSNIKQYVPGDGGQIGSPLQEAVRSINTAMEKSSTEIAFAGTNITWRNLQYLIRPKAFRAQMDSAPQEAGAVASRGLKASSPDCSGTLMRALVTGIHNARDPWHNALLIAKSAIDPKGVNPGLLQHPELISPELAAAQAQYKEYREARYPDFDEIYQRLRGFGDPAGIAAVERTIGERQAACDEQGIMLDQDAYIGDQVLNPESEHPVTALRFSEDLTRMRRYLTELAAYLEQ
jgi:hypothetical protein